MKPLESVSGMSKTIVRDITEASQDMTVMAGISSWIKQLSNEKRTCDPFTTAIGSKGEKARNLLRRQGGRGTPR